MGRLIDDLLLLSHIGQVEMVPAPSIYPRWHESLGTPEKHTPAAALNS